MKRYIFFLFASLITNQVLGNFYIKELSILPLNPTTADTIKICYKCYSPSYPNWLHNRDLNTTANELILNTCFRSGMKDGTEMLYDTIIVGTLSPGAYHLRFYWHWTMSPGDSSCTVLPYNPVDSAFLNFTVTTATNISNPNSSNISISPNPATTQLHITLPQLTQPAALTITNISGSIVQTEQLNAATTTIPINHLPAGLYFVTVQTGQQRVVKKLVKQ